MTDRELNWLVWKNVFGLNEMDCAAAGLPDVPRYATDIARAWEVIGEFQKRGYGISLEYAVEKKKWLCAFAAAPVELCDNCHSVTGVKVAGDPSPARAICLAALQAIGCEVGE